MDLENLLTEQRQVAQGGHPPIGGLMTKTKRLGQIVSALQTILAREEARAAARRLLATAVGA